MNSRDPEAACNEDNTTGQGSRRVCKEAPAPNALLCEKVSDLLTADLQNFPVPREQSLCCLTPGQHLPHCRLPRAGGSSDATPPSSPWKDRASLSLGSASTERSLSMESRILTAVIESTESPSEVESVNNNRHALDSVKSLAAQYGSASHMGILDPSYHFFLSKDHSGAFCFKLQNRVAVVAGDPLCSTSVFSNVLDEFDSYRKKRHWKLAFIGISPAVVAHAHQRHWTTIEFGLERVLSPMTNDVLSEKSGKRIVVQNKQLLHSAKRNLSLRVHIPAYKEDPALEKELIRIYDAWRNERSRNSRAFITTYDLFHIPELMVYIYTRSSDGTVYGFVVLRWIGSHQGYHLDPCVTSAGAPRGVSDLLAYSTLVFLKYMGVSYLRLGFEPLEYLREIHGIPGSLDRITRWINRRVFRRFQLRGKKARNDKFHTDREQESGLYVVLPTGVLDLPEVFAVLHTANIRIRKLI